ncbi:MAG: hypothetical protein J6I76_19000 [Oribacterium sp.]|nr:hypothetical protein [Oribacterium sp.]
MDLFKRPSEKNEEEQDIQLTQNITITKEEKDKKKSELDKLIEEAGTYRSSKEYNKLLYFIKRFPKMAPYNAMLMVLVGKWVGNHDSNQMIVKPYLFTSEIL